MDRPSCDLVELSRLAFEHFVCEPAKEDKRADRRREAEEERNANELESTRKIFSHG